MPIARNPMPANRFCDAAPRRFRRGTRRQRWIALLSLVAATLLAAGLPAKAQTAMQRQASAEDQSAQCLPKPPRRVAPLSQFIRKHRLRHRRVAGLEPCAPCPPLPRMSMKEALAKHLIDIVPCGDGVSTGYSMFMAIKSRVCNALDLDTNVNMVMIRSNYDYQDMWAFRAAGEYDSAVTTALAQECTSHAGVEQARIQADQGVSHHWRKIDRVQLAGYDPKLLILLAYCLQYKRLIPTADITFRPNPREWTPETTQLFTYLSQHPNDYSPTVIQLALWSAGEDYSAQQIASTFRFTEQDHKDACTLMNKAGLNTTKLSLCPAA